MLYNPQDHTILNYNVVDYPQVSPSGESPISASGESSLRCSDAREGFCSSLGVECWPFCDGEICRDFSNKNGDLLGRNEVILPRSVLQEHNVDFREWTNEYCPLPWWFMVIYSKTHQTFFKKGDGLWHWVYQMKQLNGSGFQSWMPHHRGICIHQATFWETFVDHSEVWSSWICFGCSGTHILALILMLDQKTRTEARCGTGVSKTIVRYPKCNGLSSWFLEKNVIWGYCILYFWTYPYLSIRYYFQLPCKDCSPWGPSFQTQVIETSKRMDHLGCIYCKQEKGCP